MQRRMVGWCNGRLIFKIPGRISKTPTASRTADFKWELDNGVSGMRLIRWKERKENLISRKDVQTVNYNLTFSDFFIACYMFRLLGKPIRQLKIYTKKDHLNTTH